MNARSIQAGLLGWVWRLLPANPIVLRVVYGASRRKRHLGLRVLYLTILTVVVMSATFSAGPGTGSLSAMAKNSSQAFKIVSYAQLALVCLLAPIFTAGAITQERDNHTYNILISTPLSNAQIVLGSLLSRLFFVIVLMASGIPVFSVTMIYGGVTTREIMISFLLASASALLMGSIAITTSVVRVGSRRTIFSFYLVIAVYLLGLWFLSEQPYFNPPALAGATTPVASYLAPLHPFLSLQVAMNVKAAPDLSVLGGLPWPANVAVARPYEAYVVWTGLLSLGLVTFSMFFVRRGIREGELSMARRLYLRFMPGARARLRRRPRTVWSNPIAWREGATRAAASGGMVRWLFILGGATAAVWLMIAMLRNWTGLGDYLMGVVLVEFGAIMLFATNLAAGSLTKEYESSTIELMLTTPMTSEYIIWGKLRGLVSAVLPLIAIPVLTLLALSVGHWIRAAAGSKMSAPVWPEAWLQAGVLMVAHVSWACLLGMNRSLYATRTVSAVMSSMALLLLVCAIMTGICLGPVGWNFGKAAAPFSPFLGLAVLSHPRMFVEIGSGAGTTPSLQTEARALTLVGTILAAFLIFLLVHQWYRSMVRNFDMIVRKKSR